MKVMKAIQEKGGEKMDSLFWITLSISMIGFVVLAQKRPPAKAEGRLSIRYKSLLH